MATYQEIYLLTRASSNIKQRISVAVSKAAQDILNEDAGIPDHTQRVAWAKHALMNAAAEAERMKWGVCGNSTIQSKLEASSDADIQDAVNALIGTFMMGI